MNTSGSSKSPQEIVAMFLSHGANVVSKAVVPSDDRIESRRGNFQVVVRFDLTKQDYKPEFGGRGIELAAEEAEMDYQEFVQVANPVVRHDTKEFVITMYFACDPF